MKSTETEALKGKIPVLQSTNYCFDSMKQDRNSTKHLGSRASVIYVNPILEPPKLDPFLK